jgi:hypothetical protein
MRPSKEGDAGAPLVLDAYVDVPSGQERRCVNRQLLVATWTARESRSPGPQSHTPTEVRTSASLGGLTVGGERSGGCVLPPVGAPDIVTTTAYSWRGERHPISQKAYACHARMHVRTTPASADSAIPLAVGIDALVMRCRTFRHMASAASAAWRTPSGVTVRTGST